MAFRKRTYGAASSSWGAKGKRGMRKKRRTFKRSSRKGFTQTSKATHGTSLPFKSRKLSRRAYSGLLWRSSILSTHYRTIQSTTSSISTQNSSAVGTIGILRPLWQNSNAFWVVAGGLQNVDSGISPPLFAGDIVIRGGMWGVHFRNSSSTLPIGIKLYVGRTIALPSNANFPGTANIGWDPTANPAITTEYARFGYNTVIQLEPGETFKMERRVKIQKVDRDLWISSGYMPVVLVFVYNIGSSSAIQVDLTTYYNMSFAGDAIGTT